MPPDNKDDYRTKADPSKAARGKQSSPWGRPQKTGAARIIGRIFLWGFAAVGALIALLVAAGVGVGLFSSPPPLPERMVLTLDIGGQIPESSAANPLAQLEGGSLTMRDLALGVERAARDDRVLGLILRLDGMEMGMAQVQELRDAIATFRASGKRAVAWAESYGGVGSGTLAYYAALACDEIWIQPSGDLDLTGFSIENPFFRDVLSKLGVEFQFGSRWEYKSAIETFTRTELSNEARQSYQTLLDSWSGQLVDAAVRARGLSARRVTALIDQGPFLAQESLDAKLVDRLGYWDELETELYGTGDFVSFPEYALRPEKASGAYKIAVIEGVGDVISREDPYRQGEPSFAADAVSEALRDAIADKSVKGVLLRIDSPGGSYTAADAIWREIGNARRAGKPVVASMGDVAASGGYFAAMAADRVVAQPGTITGSIGVFSGKVVLEELWRKVGVNWDGVKFGENSDMWSSNHPFTPRAWERMDAILDHVYRDFTQKAGEARGLDEAAMDRAARGRIWPGDQAAKIGLVDELGGVSTALRILREMAHIPKDARISLVVYPEPPSPLEFLMNLLRAGQRPGYGASLARLDAMIGKIEPFLSSTEGGILKMPPMEAK